MLLQYAIIHHVIKIYQMNPQTQIHEESREYRMGNCSEFDIIDFTRELSLLNKWLLVPNEWQLASQKIYNSFIIDWMFDLWCTILVKKLFSTKKLKCYSTIFSARFTKQNSDFFLPSEHPLRAGRQGHCGICINLRSTCSLSRRKMILGDCASFFVD